MSMLTPPGMGGQYRIKGDRYPRMRRSRGRGKIISAAVAAVVALAVLGWGTLQLIDVFSGGDDDTGSAAGGRVRPADCATPSASAAQAGGRTAKLPAPGAFKVNVLNATTRGGLAQSTADALKKRGFKIGKVGNAPRGLDKKVKASGVLVGAPGGDATARLKVLGTQLAGADTKRDARRANDVDLVLGDDFTKLTKKSAAAKALAHLRKPAPAPSPDRAC
ncbi:LytR C-terminal domain-containing protein [Streptomyces boncukensis]|uniref:LytR C-terminal domain-containing protein n=1 Tax=Streptomyces boncukensis TaxID=2711219 RepID=A0A6G4WS43_9ACTN|nr:LytR C-terminal domain-containing protein [Streptomyces boncukensis]NGO68099.1 LytR C-terminal domain-containing protein [Streptomyces boncukensis]